MKENKDVKEEANKDLKNKNKKTKVVNIIIIFIIFMIITAIGISYFSLMRKTENSISNQNRENEMNMDKNTVEISKTNEEENIINDIIDKKEDEPADKLIETSENEKITQTESNVNLDTAKSNNIKTDTISKSQNKETKPANITTESNNTKKEVDNNQSITTTTMSENTNLNINKDNTKIIEPTPVEKVLKDTYKLEELIESKLFKYGIMENTYKIIEMGEYSDGSQEEIRSSTYTKLDKTKYKATTEELLSEAKIARSSNAGMINRVFENVNSYRKEANEQKVDGITNRENFILDEILCTAASVRAVEMSYSNKFEHTRPNGSNCFSVLKEVGATYWSAGENIACGQTTADSVSASWKKSPQHYSNMISSEFKKIGIGVYKTDGQYYWVQLFTN